MKTWILPTACFQASPLSFFNLAVRNRRMDATPVRKDWTDEASSYNLFNCNTLQAFARKALGYD